MEEDGSQRPSASVKVHVGGSGVHKSIEKRAQTRCTKDLVHVKHIFLGVKEVGKSHGCTQQKGFAKLVGGI